ncbi:MAG: hypothetical protein JWO67_1060 [Streptosporangiaceae bacterium]|nr:hypothetical protein [Streptosporangiaceae bacterium]
MIHGFLARWRNGYWRLCLHRSHRLNLPCYRGQTYDHQCGKHNDSCFHGCVTARRIFNDTEATDA